MCDITFIATTGNGDLQFSIQLPIKSAYENSRPSLFNLFLCDLVEKLLIVYNLLCHRSKLASVGVDPPSLDLYFVIKDSYTNFLLCSSFIYVIFIISTLRMFRFCIHEFILI